MTTLKLKLGISLLFLELLFNHTNCFSQNECSAILQQGIYDYSTVSMSHEKSLAFINWFKNNSSKTYEEAHSLSLTGSVPIDGVLVGMGFTKDDNGFTELKNYMESYTSKSEGEKMKFDKAIQSINQSVVDAWSKCINRDGLSFWIESTKDPRTFILNARFRDPGAGVKPFIKSIDFANSRITNNDGVFRKRNGQTNQSTKLNAGILKQSFRRVDNGPLTIVVNPSFGDAFQYSFASLVKTIENDSHKYAMVWDGQGKTDPQEFEIRYLQIHQNANPMSGFLKYKLTQNGFYILDGVGESIEKIKSKIQAWREAYKNKGQIPNEYTIIDLECLKNNGAQFSLNKEGFFQSGDDSQLPPQINPSCIKWEIENKTP